MAAFHAATSAADDVAFPEDLDVGKLGDLAQPVIAHPRPARQARAAGFPG